MRDSFLKGQYTIHQNFLPQTYLGASDEAPFTYNIEKAKELLAKAGVDGLEIEIGVREAQERIEIGQSFQNAAAQAGIKVNITLGTATQILGRYRARELDVYLGAWGPDYPDPQTNAGTFAYNPDNSDEANATGLLAWRNSWDTGGLTEKVTAAVTENDRDTRIRMYEEIQSEFRDTSPFVVMFQQIEQSALRDNVMNWSTGQAVTSAAYWQVTK
jgi:peptide/nickel transport system substrate-binding protein